MRIASVLSFVVLLVALCALHGVATTTTGSETTDRHTARETLINSFTDAENASPAKEELVISTADVKENAAQDGKYQHDEHNKPQATFPHLATAADDDDDVQRGSEKRQGESLLPLCSDWLSFTTSSSSSSTEKDAGISIDTGDRSGECVLPVSPHLDGDRSLLFRSGGAAAAAVVTTAQESGAVVWQLGPASPATQSVTINTMHSYFLNVSSRRHPDAAAAAGQDDDDSSVDMLLARRLRAYSTLHAPQDAQSSIPSRARASAVQRKDERDGGQHEMEEIWWLSAVHNTINQLVVPGWNLAVSLLDRIGAWTRLQRYGEEVYANARLRSWTSRTTWRNIFYTRRLVVRFPVGVWHTITSSSSNNDNTYGEDMDEDRDALSRMDMLTRGTLGLLRVVSFPPMAQRTSPSSSASSATSLSSRDTASLQYVCSLSAISAAARVVHEDQLAFQRAFPQKDAQNGRRPQVRDAPAFASAKRNTATRGASAATVRGTRGTLVSYALNFVVRLARRLLLRGEEADFFDSGSSGENLGLFGAEGSLPPTKRVIAAHAARRGSSSPSMPAALQLLRNVREELGPFQPAAASSLPLALQQLLGRRVLHSHTELIEVEEEEKAAEKGRQAANARAAGRGGHLRSLRGDGSGVTFYMEWTAMLSAGAPLCLALVALPGSDSASVTPAAFDSEEALLLHVEEKLVLDHVWLLLIVSAYVVLQLERRVGQSALARHVVTGLTGSLLLFVVGVFYLVRELQRMSVGKLAVVTALLLGGSTAALEGLWSVLWSYYNLDALWSAAASHTNNDDADEANGSLFSGVSMVLLTVVGVAALLCAVSGVVLTVLIPVAYLRTATRWSVRVLLALLWWLCLRHNLEATIATCIAYLVVSRALRWFLAPRNSISGSMHAASSSASQQPQQRWRRAEPSQTSVGDGWGLEDPQDDVPDAARQTRAYVRPLAASAHHDEYASLSSTERRLRKYDEDGAAHTRQALEQLAAHLRANPGAYATRLRDPNAVQRWAGEASDDD